MGKGTRARTQRTTAESLEARRKRAETKRVAHLVGVAAASDLPAAQRNPETLAIAPTAYIDGHVTAAKETVRKLTRIERLQRSGLLEQHEAAACEWFADKYALGFDTIGVTANYEGRSGGGAGPSDLLARHVAITHARDDYWWAREVVPVQYRAVFEDVILRGATLSAAAEAAFDQKRSQGEAKARAAVKLCANLLHQRLAPLLPIDAAPAAPARSAVPTTAIAEPANDPIAEPTPLRDHLDAAIAARGATGDLVVFMMARATRDALAREMRVPAAELHDYSGIEIHVVDTWNWGLIFQVRPQLDLDRQSS